MAGEETTNIPQTTTEQPQPERAPTQDEQYAQIAAAFNSVAPQNPKWGFGRELIDPRAAAALPPNPQVGAIGKVGLFNVWGTSGVQFPFAAWAQQHEPYASPNTKAMQKTIAELTKTPEGDPRVQRGIDNFISNDILNGTLKEGEEMFGGMGNVTRILEGQYRTQAERDWDMKVHRQMSYAVNAANLTKDVAAQIKAVQENMNKGEMPNADFVSAVNQYHTIFTDPSIPIDQKVEMTEKLRDKIDSFANIDTIAKQYSPENFKWGEIGFITGAKEVLPNGQTKDIPRTYSDWKVINPDGTDISPQFRDTVDKIYNRLKLEGNDLGIKDEDKRKEYIAQFLADKSPKQSTETISREQSTSISLKVPAQTPLTTGADKFNDFNTKFANSNSTVKDATYPSSVQKYFFPPKKSKAEDSAVVFESKIPAEELSKVESNPAWGIGVLSHALTVDGQSFSNTDEYQIMTSNQTQVQPEEIDGKKNPNAGKPFPKPEINLDGISMVYGTDPDGDKGFQPTTILKDPDKTGKELNQEGYTPYYRMQYTVNYYDKDGKPQKKTLYHYVDSRNDGANRALDDFFLSQGTAKDIEALTQ